jgi:hypothetical protein
MENELVLKFSKLATLNSHIVMVGYGLSGCIAQRAQSLAENGHFHFKVCTVI